MSTNQTSLLILEQVSGAQGYGLTRLPGSEINKLTTEILHLANAGIPKVDFLREASRRVLRLTGDEVLLVWVEENGRCARSLLVGQDQERHHLELVACPRQDPVAPSTGAALLCAVEPSHRGLCVAARNTQGLLRFPGGDLVPDGLLQEAEAVTDCATLAPLVVGESCIGWVLLAGRQQPGPAALPAAELERAIQVLAMAIVSQGSQAALRERVKELTGLYRLSQLADRPGVPLDELLQGIAELLPPAWQYAEIAVGRVVLDQRCYVSGPITRRIAHQTADIIVDRQRRGLVEVIYQEPRPVIDEGPFLQEERNLLNAIAREVAATIERRQAAAERSRLEEQLLHADRLATIGQLAAGVAHELNEPLGAVLGFAQLARKEPSLPASVDSDLAKIESSALHAREIVKKLMLFARQTPPREIEVDLTAVIGESLYFLEARCKKHRIEIVRRLDPNLPYINADPSQLQQVLVNLVVNAVQAMPDGGQLTIETQAVSGRSGVRLIVADTGPGMSDEVRQQAFLPFFTTKDVNEGTGLGLAVVHGIVTSHNGVIRLESAEGRGATFIIELPADRS